LLGEALGEGAAAGDVDVDGAGEEVVDDVEVVGGEAGDGVGGEIDGVGIHDRGGWNNGREGSGGDGAGSGTAPERGFGGVLMYNQGAGGEVTEALVAAIAEHDDDADGVEAGEGVDDADEVAGEGFEEGDLAAGVADDAELAESFARGLAVPEGFEEGVVAPVDEEVKDDDGGDEPFFVVTRDALEASGRGADNENDDEEEDGPGDALEDGVGEDGEEAAADACDGEADGDLLRSVDGKLVGSFGHCGAYRGVFERNAGMISNRWIEQRQGLWQRLDMLLVQAESSGLKSLSGDELRELGLLYRQVAQDLSAVRADRGSRTQEEYLNLLLARAHNRVYSGRKLEARQVVRFFAVEYPRIFRRLFPYVAVSVMIFLAGAALGALLSFSRPAFERMVLGPTLVASIEKHEMWTKNLLSAGPQASTWIMTNNISVGFMTFAGGMLAGLGTLYLLFFNGLQLGVVGTACAQARMALDLWSFVASHGAL